MRKVVVFYERKRSSRPAYSCALSGAWYCRQYSGESVRSGTIYNLQYVEHKSKNPGVVSIQKICDGLGISVREFFDDPLFENLEPVIK